MLNRLQSAVPLRSKAAWIAHASGISVALCPHFGLVPRTAADLQAAGLLWPEMATGAPLFLGASLGLFYGAKALELFQRKPKPGIWAGDMFIEVNHLWTSIMCTGRPSAGKTSGFVMPVAEQIFQIFNGPDYIMENGVSVENPFARIGGLVLEVKGEFYEMIAYLMDREDIRRNVYEDFLIIRPDSRIPLAQFEEPSTGHLFYVNGLPCSSGSDAGVLLKAAQKAVAKEEQIPDDIFMRANSAFKDALDRLRSLEYPVEDPDICFAGWRRESGRLVRVSHTPEFRKPAYVLDAQGNKIYIDVPKKLKFLDRILVSNGLIYNLIDQNVGAVEAAEKLTKMAAMAGRGETGDKNGNVFWTANAQKLISNCISMHRALHPNVPVTCAHVFNMVANDEHLAAETKLLNKHLNSLRAEAKRILDLEKKAEFTTRDLMPLELVEVYFSKEWVTLEEKIKTTVKSMVSNTFANFVQDPALYETFCGTPTFHFSESLQKGRVFAFVPGPFYKNMAKVIGTGLNIDNQATDLARIDRADYNRKRPQLRLIDECWNWVIAGGQGGGDPHFLSLCRQARVINILATQNYDQFVSEIGEKATNNYLGQFGIFVWLQSFNSQTNRFAEELMVKTKREKLQADQTDTSARMKQEWEEKKLFTAGDFVELGADEGIVFNGFRKRHKAIKTKLPKSRLTHPDEAPAIAKFMRQFFAGSVEQALWKQKRVSRLDHTPAPAQQPTTASTPQQASAQKTPTSAGPAAGTSATPNTPPTGKPSFTLPPSPPKNSGSPASPAAPNATPPVAPADSPAGITTAPGPSATPPRAPQAFTPPATSRQATPTPSPVPPPIGASRKLEFRAEAGQRAKAPQGSPNASPKPQHSNTPNGRRRADKGTDGLTPSRVDRDSAEFQEAWNRLTVAAAEVSMDDEYAIQPWFQQLAQKTRSGEVTSHLVTTGPSGHSVGDKAMLEKASTIKADQPERLEQHERAPREAKLRQHAEQSFQQRAGIPHEEDALLD